MTDWTGVEPLPLGATILLEASAGTGKTWQIEGLVVRLVAEHEVPIDRILVITFTNPATAELRSRIRSRLISARDALAEPAPPKDDPIEKMIWADPEKRATRRSLLATAVSSFDLAAISTIHGFSQRVLDQLAFESGQEPGLELLADPRPILQQLVDDELARVYAEATEEELRVLADMGWTRRPLGKLAAAMTKAVPPVLEPDCSALDPYSVDSHSVDPHSVDPHSVLPLDPVRAWLEAKADLRAWLDSTEGLASVDAVRGELDRKKGKRVKRMRRDVGGKHLAAVKSWLDGPALRSSRASGSGLPTSVRNLRLEALENAWTGTKGEMESFAGYPLFGRVSALLAEQDRLWPRALLGFASRARAYVEDELVRSGRLTYSTMLSRLAERIAEQASEDGQEGSLVQAIRSRFDVALVDEFQDTDGAQWPVMRAVFAHPTRRLLIIGDPKQAIYAFRGADVHVYLDAARVAHTRATMRTNWRSDGTYIAAMNHIWAEGSNAFELDEVDYVEIGPAPERGAARIRGLPAQGDRARRAFELRWVDGDTVGISGRLIGNKDVGQNTTAELAALDAARLLEGETEICVARDGEGDPEYRPLRPGDIAVLVRTNDQAERVRRHLDRLGIPSVSAGRGSVMASPVLGWLCTWLDAVADPGRDRPARALAVTPLFGWTALDLATAISAVDAATDGELPHERAEAARTWERWLRGIRAWAADWLARGFVRVFETALDDFDVVRRLLGARQGERYATDLRHLVELCHSEERRTRVGPSGLASWLRASRDSGSDGQGEAEALRLESDAHAIQIVTIHKSKGLEYPVVLLPFGWADFQSSDKGGPIEWHAQVGERTEIRLNLELPGTGERQRAADRSALEARQEQLRLLYVALTRARHHCVAWLGPLGSAGADMGSSALGNIVLRERDVGGVPVEGGASLAFPKSTSRQKPEVRERQAAESQVVWEEIRVRLDRLADTSDLAVGWSIEPRIEARERLSLALDSPGALEARCWPDDRPLNTPWQVSSYSAMVAGRTFDASEPQRRDGLRATAEEPAPPGDGGGAQVELGEPVPVAHGLEAPIATRELHGGTEVGTWVHAVFEHLDFQGCTGSDGRDIQALVAELGARHGVRSTRQHELLAAALPGMLDTPLDGGGSGLPAGFSLRALRPADRLDELRFDFRLGDGNRWRYEPGGSVAGPSADGSLRNAGSSADGSLRNAGSSADGSLRNAGSSADGSLRNAGSSADGSSWGLLNPEGARVALQSRVGTVDPGRGEWGGDDWLCAVLDRAAHEGTGVLPRIVGILTGFIDLTFRVEVPSEGGGTRHRYFVSDYKTNRIAPTDHRRDSRLLHYTRPWMAWEMAHHGYHLQALLYTVALHRMLRQRLPDYAYDTHVGGHLYLFLRGMTGPDTPRDAGLSLGVFFDRWPASVVLGLDAALSGASTGEVEMIVEEACAGGDIA